MKENNATIIPTMRYKDAPAAIEWLCKTFGFEKHMVVAAENGSISHAQLTFGNGMIMLGSENDTEYGKFMKTPVNFKGINTQAPYIIVENIDEHYQKTKSAGAEIIIDIKDEDYGGRDYSCRDMEGYIWNFGSYNPWKEEDE